MNMHSFPAIRVELTEARQAITMAIHERQLAMDQYVKDALDRELTPERIQLQVDKLVKAAVDQTLRDAIDRFFRWGGAGGDAIRDAATKQLARTLDEMGFKKGTNT